MRNMQQHVEERSREAILVEDAHIRPMMGFEILEPLPSPSVPYGRVDPFILVHESRLRLSELNDVDTKHPHRGFDNLWYILEGSASTGHSTGPGGAIERASGLACVGFHTPPLFACVWEPAARLDTSYVVVLHPSAQFTTHRGAAQAIRRHSA
jgi:hypothetical protein